MNSTATEPTETHEQTWTEEIEVFGHELVKRLKELVAEGNVRRLVIRSPEGHVLVEVPLTAGVAVGGAVTIVMPVLAALGALAALLAHVKVEIYRTSTPHPDDAGDPTRVHNRRRQS